MITKYQNFLLESDKGKVSNNYTKKDPEYFGITDYKWVSGRLDCYQDVDINPSNIFDENVYVLPFKFGVIDGDFDCSDFNLTSLKNSPVIVKGYFDCAGNKLKSFDGGPKEVHGRYYCTRTGERNIEDYPMCIIGDDINNVGNFRDVNNIVKNNKEIFIPLMNDKIKFHQMIMRLDPTLIRYYKTIPPPLKKLIFFDI